MICHVLTLARHKNSRTIHQVREVHVRSYGKWQHCQRNNDLKIPLSSFGTIFRARINTTFVSDKMYRPEQYSSSRNQNIDLIIIHFMKILSFSKIIFYPLPRLDLDPNTSFHSDENFLWTFLGTSRQWYQVNDDFPGTIYFWRYSGQLSINSISI